VPGDGNGEALVSLFAIQPSGTRLNPGTGIDSDFTQTEIHIGKDLYMPHTSVRPVQAPQYEAYLKERKISTIANPGQDLVFPGIFPTRSFIDDDFVQRLVLENVVEEKLALAILMVDFPNPLFSKKRCSLLGRVPETSLKALSNSSGSPDPKMITDEVVKGMSDAGPAGIELKTNLDKSGKDFGLRIASYLKKCATGPERIADADKAYRLLRAKNQKLISNANKFAIESFVMKMFPESENLVAKTYASEEDLGLSEECGLNAQ